MKLETYTHIHTHVCAYVCNNVILKQYVFVRKKKKKWFEYPIFIYNILYKIIDKIDVSLKSICKNNFCRNRCKYFHMKNLLIFEDENASTLLKWHTCLIDLCFYIHIFTTIVTWRTVTVEWTVLALMAWAELAWSAISRREFVGLEPQQVDCLHHS